MTPRGLGILCALALASPALAAGTESEDDHQLSLAGGIAAPACSTAPFQNPAGLVYNSSFKLTVQGGAGDSFSDPLLRGGALGGNGNFGAGAGLGHDFRGAPAQNASSGSTRSRARTDSSASAPNGSGSTDAWYGLGVALGSPGLALGVAGQTELAPGSGSSFNAGTLIHPNEKLRVGATAIDVNNGVDEIGLGLAAEPAQGLTFVLDTSADTKTSHVAAQPAVAVGNRSAALTVGYGFGGGSRELSDGFSAGGSLKLGQSTSWQLYYNQLSTYYTAISFGF